jgi:hypothetical protein
MDGTPLGVLGWGGRVKGTPPTADGPLAWAWVVPLQADPHGLHCEFCQTQREIITTPATPDSARHAPSYYTKIGSHQEFAAVWGPASNSSKEALPLWSEAEQARQDAANTALAQREIERDRPAVTADRLFVAGATVATFRDLLPRTGEYYLLVKLATTDAALASRWETLHRG